MKNFFSSFLLFLIISTGSFCQTPSSLVSDVQVTSLMDAHLKAIRICKDPVTGDLFYLATSGEIYRIYQPIGLPAYDSLVYTVADHGVQYVQGFVIHDSTFYLAGNQNISQPTSQGIIVRGTLKPNGSRLWDTVAISVPYAQAGIFDHRFSGLVINPAGDTLIVCSGTRTDHGEENTRNGMFPGMRDEPITAKLLAIPAFYKDSIIPNDSAALINQGYLFASGVRNFFDMAYAANGDLFATENSGDRDHNEELNWVQQGHHYGFPWVMGDELNPQQFPGYDPSTDLMINHNSLAWTNGKFYNDSTFPPPPPGITFDAGVQNLGPDADKFRDPSTGLVNDASDAGVDFHTFTAHRSPLGLVFDNDSDFGANYTGDAFVLSYTKGGDSTGTVGTGIGPFVDPSEDLLHLHLSKVGGTYQATVNRLVQDFRHPVDGVRDENKIYVLENAFNVNPQPPHIYVVTFPPNVVTLSENQVSSLHVYPNPFKENFYIQQDKNKMNVEEINIVDLTGRIIHSLKMKDETMKISFKDQKLSEGIYLLNARFTDGSKKVIKLVKK